MKKTIETLLWFCMGVVVAFTLVNVYTTFNKPRKAETTLAQKKSSVKIPYVHILPYEEPTVTIPLQKKMKLELAATIEEFQYYFSNGGLIVDEAMNHIVIVGESAKNDTTKLKWSVYY